jgi:hypothetical protein
MPDFSRMQWAALTAAAIAAFVVLICAWPRRSPHPRLYAFGWTLGLAGGFYGGCLLLDLSFHWPPNNVEDRFLTLLLPAVIVVELLASMLPSWAAWTLRSMIAVGAGPLLLHQSRYVARLPGMDGADWSPAEQVLIQGGLGASLAIVWMLLAVLWRRTPGRFVPLALALPCLATGLTIMLSDYATGGPVAFPLAGALAGAALVASSGSTGTLGLGIVGLFGMLVAGRFFAALTTTNALLLFLAPLLLWVPEGPYLHRIWRWLRGCLGVLLVGAVVAFVLWRAKTQFDLDTRPPSGAPEPTIDDYRNYGQ